jgi:hypothetical protein
MTAYHLDDRVQVFDPALQHLVPGTVLTATTGCVLVSLDDRMVPLAVDPADHFAIQRVEAMP